MDVVQDLAQTVLFSVFGGLGLRVEGRMMGHVKKNISLLANLPAYRGI